MALVVFLLSIAGVSASEIDNTIASENANTIELSADNDIEDNLQTSEENEALASTDYDEAIAQTDTEVLGADSAKYSDLAAEISQPGNINLTHKNYTYDKGETITISEDNKVIDGNGAVIDMNGSTIGAFYISGSGVTIKNLTIKNANYNGYGGAIYFDSTGTVTNCNFTDNSAYRGGAVFFYYEGTVSNCNFTNNTADYGGAITMGSGTVSNCNFTDNTASGDGGAIRMYSGTVSNCNFTDNEASHGGAVYFLNTGNVTNCNFTDNTATYKGGAVYFLDTGNVTNCNFTNNKASVDGGAVYFLDQGTVSNCNFTGNNATTGSAIYFYKWDSSDTLTVSNSRFLNNRANAEELQVTKNENNITIIFKGHNNLLNAIYSRNDAEVTFINVTYWGANGINNTGSSEIKPSRSKNESGQNITVGIVVNGILVLNEVKVTDENGMIVLPIKIESENYYIGARHDKDSYYTEAERTISNMTFRVNVTSQTTTNKTVNITAKSNIYSEVMPGKLLFILPNSTKINATYAGNGAWWAVHTFDDYADYQVNATYEGLDNVTITNATISISKTPTNITVENTTVNLFVLDSVATGAALTPADAGNLTFTSSNSSVAKVENGKIIAVGEGTANITVSFAGSDDYAAAESKNITVTVSLNDASVSVNDETLVYLFVDDYFSIVAVTSPAGLNVTFVGDNSGVVSVDADGVVTALSEGTATITVKVGGDGIYAENSTVVTFTVLKISTEITIDSASLDMFVGDEALIVANLTPEDAGNVTFTSSNESVVEVDVQGNVIAQGKGQAIITVSFAGNNKYAAAENRTINVTVSLNDASVTVDNNTLNLKAGEAYAINATKHPDTIMLDITYTSSNSSVATVNEKGIVTAVGVGTAVITVEVGDDEIYAKNSTNVTVTVSKASTEIGAKPVTATYNVNRNLVITLTDANGNPVTGVSLSVDLNGAKKYTTDKNGQVKVSTKGLDPKTYTAKITFNGNANYVKSSKNVKVTVKKAKPKIIAKKKKTYRANAKTKKLKITLKDNTGKPIKNAKVRLMLKKIGKGSKKKTKPNKKIAKTNKKGKATFKVKKNKKAKYQAYVKFYANKHYMKTVKKIKITIK